MAALAPILAAAVPVRKYIQVHIDPSTVLSYKKPTKFASPTSNPNGKLSVVNPLPYMIEEGTRITIDNNVYVLVSEFVDTNDAIPQQPAKRELVQELAIGTIIEQKNGIAVPIAASLVVQLPEFCKIKLSTGTRLQQISAPIRLTVDKEFVATIVPS